MTSDPGPKPEPETERPQRFPGGADAVDDDSGKYGDTPGEPTIRDLHPAVNPATGEAPGEVAEPDDKQQEGDSSDPEEDSASEDPPA